MTPTPPDPQDGHPPPPSSSVSSSSQPGTPSSNTHTLIMINGVQQTHGVSSAIIGGADRLLALFKEELARVQAQHKKQTDDLIARFDEFRNYAAQEQQKLADRIYLLEAELAARGGVPMHAVNVNGQTDTVLDMETIHFVQDLARLVKGAELTTTQQRMANSTPDTVHLPQLFLPALARYLASHRQTLHDLQEKLRVCSASPEDDRLKETLMVTSFALQPSVHRNDGFDSETMAVDPYTFQQPSVHSNNGFETVAVTPYTLQPSVTVHRNNGFEAVTPYTLQPSVTGLGSVRGDRRRLRDQSIKKSKVALNSKRLIVNEQLYLPQERIRNTRECDRKGRVHHLLRILTHSATLRYSGSTLCDKQDLCGFPFMFISTSHLWCTGDIRYGLLAK
ncbi:hypothetical protein C0995_012443 [Termitomyces sp. Mi166|nr:hypothetical protein C0995_012443 [Termitomyces sp. Mi166\